MSVKTCRACLIGCNVWPVMTLPSSNHRCECGCKDLGIRTTLVKTGNLQGGRPALVPVLIFINSPANLILGIFSLDLVYAGDKLGGMWFSPTSHLGTG